MYAPANGNAGVAKSLGDGSFATAYFAGGAGTPLSGIGVFDFMSTLDTPIRTDIDGTGNEELFVYRPASAAAWVIQYGVDGKFNQLYP